MALSFNSLLWYLTIITKFYVSHRIANCKWSLSVIWLKLILHYYFIVIFKYVF